MDQVVFRLPVVERPIFHLICRTCGARFDHVDDWRKFCGPACYRPPGTMPRFAMPVKREPVRYALGELTPDGMRNLLRRWIAQGRACIYCGRPGTTIDHLIPRSRGGKNFVGNLAPCCRSCNSRKGSMLVIEFRAGRLSKEQKEYRDNPSRRYLKRR